MYFLYILPIYKYLKPISQKFVKIVSGVINKCFYYGLSKTYMGKINNRKNNRIGVS
jgi:hypothetical protein